MSGGYHFEDEVDLGAYDSEIMKRLLVYLRPHVKLLVVAAVLLLLATVMTTATPYIVMLAIDDCIATAVGASEAGPDGAAVVDERIRTLAWLMAAFAVLAVLDSILRYCQIIVLTFVGQKTLRNMRLEVFSHLQRMSLSFLDRNPVGRLLTRVTNDVENIQQTIVTGMVQSLGEVISILLAVTVMFWLNWHLTLVTLGSIPIILAASLIFRRFVRPSFQEVRRKIAAVNAFMQENVSGMKIIQVFGHEDESYKRFERYNADHRDEWFRQVRYYAYYSPIVDTLGTLTVAVIILVGGLQILEETVPGNWPGGLLGEATRPTVPVASIGMVYAYMQWAQRMFGPIRALAERYNMLQAAMASAERIFRLLDTPPDIVEKDDPFTPQDLRGHVAFNNVTFSYEEGKEVLKNVSFEVAPGEHVAIVGHTGAGKTTIASLLSRFYDVQGGSITVDGVDLRDYDLTTLRTNTGVVLQDVFLFSGDIDFNIRLGDEEMTEEHIHACAEYVNAARFIEKVPGQYRYDVGERGCNLSTGQRQLLAFARTLAHDPRILILDEATSSVDTETEALIQDAILKLMGTRTSIVIAHRLSTVQHADRIIVLHHGEIREMGTHQELLANKGLYYTLYRLQYQDQSSAA